MTHLSEDSNPLVVKKIVIKNRDDLFNQIHNFNDVCLLRLPFSDPDEYGSRLKDIGQLVAKVAASLGPKVTLITLGEPVDLVRVHTAVISFTSMRYQQWIAIKRPMPQSVNGFSILPRYHLGALIHTNYQNSLAHTKTRTAYTYCPACNKTTKDYGGKKHTYHQYGTLISDVWRDVRCDLNGDLDVIINRFADLFGIEDYQELRVFDLRELGLKRASITPVVSEDTFSSPSVPTAQESTLRWGDCLERLREIPDNSVDFAFADPPYNLGKKYVGYADDLEIEKYFKWCDEWITELARVIRPGRTCAILNIPLWSIRHFTHLEKIMNFQSWIAWDALSYPVRKIMPAHYTILCFSKGTPRQLPGLLDTAKQTDVLTAPKTFKSLEPLAEGFCLRARCVNQRQKKQINDRGPLSNLWWDIHRLKHNTRRVDHPCQLPPHLMYRLIAVFTEPNEMVLDCFNGAGTTTLAAHQLGRRYIGIEKSEKYHDMALSRHEEINQGLDPFRKAERVLTAKNSPVPRMPKQKYKISKKTLQLDVKRIAESLGRLPSRDEVIERSEYPIEYYDNYFASWGEVCAAARTTGMTEDKEDTKDSSSEHTL